MSYCNTADVVNAYDDGVLIQLTDDEDDGSISLKIIDIVVGNVASEIDGYLSKIYELPLSEVPGNLQSIALDISLYRLYCRRQGPPEYVVKLYDDAIAYLMLVSEGKIELAISQKRESATGASSIFSGNPARLFTREKMVSF